MRVRLAVMSPREIGMHLVNDIVQSNAETLDTNGTSEDQVLGIKLLNIPTEFHLLESTYGDVLFVSKISAFDCTT